MLFFSFCLGSDAVGIFLFPEARLLASCSRENTQLCVTGILLLQSTSHQRKELCNNSVSASILIPHLQNLVKQTAFQQGLITDLLSNLQQNERVDAQSRGQSMGTDTVVEASTAEGERSLLVKIFELQSRMISLTDELIAAKLKHVQLQEELNALYCQEEIVDMREEENE